MPAPSPAIPQDTQNALTTLGQHLRTRRLAMGVSAARAAECAGMSRVTWYRLEEGSPSVTMGAYLNAAAALGLEFRLDRVRPPEPEPADPQLETPPPEVVRVDAFPQLKLIAWQLRPDTELSGHEALELYERNWRHIDHEALTGPERVFIQQLANAYSEGVLLV